MSDIPLPPKPPRRKKIHRKPSRPDRRATHLVKKEKKELDATLSQDDWRNIYVHYAKTGDPAKLSKMTGLDEKQVEHCIEIGIDRLSLPPIREYARDSKQVTERILDMKLDPENAIHQEKPLYQELPESHKDELIDRTAKEAVGAQMALGAAMEVSSTFYEILTKVRDRVNLPEEEGGLKLPDNISLGYIKTLANTASVLTSTLDQAIRLNRLTQGEPEHNINVEISYLLNKLPEEAIVRFAKEGKIPPQLRGRVEQNIIDVDADEGGDNDE